MNFYYSYNMYSKTLSIKFKRTFVLNINCALSPFSMILNICHTDYKDSFIFVCVFKFYAQLHFSFSFIFNSFAKQVQINEFTIFFLNFVDTISIHF